MKKLVTEKDVDNLTVVIAENKVQSRLVFGQKMHILDTYSNGLLLLFREIKNGDDRIAVCTGYFYEGKWQLDSPDNTHEVNWNGTETPPTTSEPGGTYIPDED